MKKRVGLLLLSLSLALGSLLALTACGNNSEKVIREALVTEMDSFKAADAAALGEVTSQMSDLKTLGIDPDDFLKVWLEDFDYSIGAIKVDGDKATAEITITVKQLGPVLTTFQTELTKLAADDAFLDLTSAQQMTKSGEVLMAAMQEQKTTTESFTMTYTLVNKTWTPDSSNEATIMNIFLGQTS
jgi:hypothetical protein